MKNVNSLLHNLLISVLLLGTSLNGQTQRDRSTSIFDDLDQKNVRMPISTPQLQGAALESTVDPERYFVGPSDIIAVNIWISPPVSFSLTVTPEGTLIVPSVGEIKVADLTLSEAKKRVLSEVRKKYISGDATVTLIYPRSIVVTVTGLVLNPGLYTLTSVDRADRGIEEANKPRRTQTEFDVTRILDDMSTRNVVLKHKDGSTSSVDVAKFLATKEERWNPYLREGDVIIVPRKNRVKNVIGIYGEVNVPGRYEFVDSDSIKDAIRIAHGFTKLAMTDSIEFSRLGVQGSTTTTRFLNGHQLFDGQIADIVLQPGDRIIVRARPDLREDYRATIVGEVLYPGTYPITKDRTRLRDLVEKAGGFTEYASLKSAEFLRRSVSGADIELERLLSSRGSVSPDDSAYYYLETELRIRKEIVNVDFEKLFLQSDNSQDVVLMTEDYIVVPSMRKTVYVFGQVVSPGHIPFMNGENQEYYVRKAGGYTDRARRDDIRIIKSKTKQWLAPDETTIEAGDHIWVPKVPERTFAYYMTVWSQAASVMSVVVGIAVIILQVAK